MKHHAIEVRGRLNFDESAFVTDAKPGDYLSPYPDGLPGHRGTDTETAAAVSVLASCTEACRRAYEFIDGKGRYGATDYEGGLLCFYSFARRRCDLHKHDPPFVVDSGHRRKTPRGADAIVWVTARVAEGGGRV